LFTAIELGDRERAQASAMTSALRERVEQAAPDARVTWIGAERLHVTLRFIGEADVQHVEDITAALRLPLPLPPFTIGFGALGAFPPRGAPRVIWIGIDEGRDAVIRVESAVSQRLLGVGIAGEDRPYSPHLTLARVREPAGLRAASLFAGLSPSPGRTRVDAITLFESRLSPKGPTYVVLQRTPLRPAEMQ
jgi:2'-5' RNA ligase